MPSDLIKRSQTGFRNDAGLASYKPTLKSLNPTVVHTSALSGVDTCIRCEAKLLRGSHSLICVYCGQCQANHLPPKPILFNSTTAYCWLLESLELNALERIGCFFEEDTRNNGGTPVDEAITLDEHLDVKITWRDEVESFESGLVNETFDVISFLNLARVENFDMDFGGGSGSDLSEEQSVSSKIDEIDAFIDQDNLGPFQNDAPLEDDVISSGGDEEDQFVSSSKHNEDNTSNLSRGSLSGDEAELPSVISKMQDEDFEANDISSDMRENFPSAHDVEVQSTEDSKTNLSKDSFSGDEVLKSGMQNEDFATAVSPDLRRDSSSEDDVTFQKLNSGTENEDSKIDFSRDSLSGDEGLKIAVVSSYLRGNSSSEEDAKLQILKSSTQNKGFKTNADLSKDSSSEHEDLNFRIQNVKTAVVSSDLRGDSSSEDDAKVQILNSSTQNEDAKIDLSRDSSSGDENFNSRMENEKTAIVSSNLKGDSSSEDDLKVQVLNTSTHNEDSKTNADLKGDSSSEDDLKVQVLNTSTHNKDSKTNADLKGDSSSEDDLKVQVLMTTTHNKDSKGNADLRGDSSSEDDAKVPVLNLSTQDADSKTDLNIDSSSVDEDLKPRMQNEDSKNTVVSSDLRGSSSSEDDSKAQILSPSKQNEDSYTHLRRDSLSEDEDLNSKIQNEKTAVVSSNLRGDSSSEDDAKVQVLNFSTQDVDSKTDLSQDSLSEDEDFKYRMQNEDSKTAVVSSDLRGDSSSEDDAKVQILNSGTQNEDSKTNADLRGDSSSEDEAKVQILDFKTNPHLSRDSSSGDDAEVQSLKFKTQHDGTITVDVSPHPRSHSSSEDDAKVQNLNSGTQNQDSKTNADMSRDSSSGDDKEIESLKFRTRDDDSKIVDGASDLRGDTSSEDDEKVQILSSNTQNEDSKTDLNIDSLSGDKDKSRMENEDLKTGVVSSDMRGGSSSEDDDAKVLIKNSGTQNEVFKPIADLSRDSSSGDDTEIQSSNFNAQTDGTVAASSDLRGHSSSEDEEEIQSVRIHDESPKVTASRDSSSGDDADITSANFRLHDQDSKSIARASHSSSDGSSKHNAEIQPESSRIQTGHSKTTIATSSDLRRDSSSDDETETKSTDSKTADLSYEDSSRYDATDLGRDSSSGDEPNRQSVNFRLHDQDSKSIARAADSSSDDSSKHNAELQPVSSRIQTEHSKPTITTSSDLRRDSSSDDETETKSTNSKTADLPFEDSPRHDAEVVISSDLGRNSSSGDELDRQSVNLRTHDTVNKSSNNAESQSFRGQDDDFKAAADAMPSDLFRDSSYGDDAEIQSVNRMQNADSKSVDSFVGSESNLSAHIDMVPEHIEDLNDETHDD